MVEGQVPALPPEHFLSPFSKDRGKIKATSDYTVRDGWGPSASIATRTFSNPMQQGQGQNEGNLWPRLQFWWPNNQTIRQQQQRLRRTCKQDRTFRNFFFLSEHSTNGTSLVKTLSMPPLPMPIYICSRQNPQILGPLCCLPSQSWWWPLMDGSCDVSYPDPDQNNHFKSQTSLLKRLHCWTNNVPSWSKPGTIFKKVFLTDHMIQVQ